MISHCAASSLHRRPLSTIGLVGSTYSPCPRRSGVFLCSKADQNQTKHTSTLCPSPRISVRICLDSRPPSHHSSPWSAVRSPQSRVPSFSPSPSPDGRDLIPLGFLATSSVRRIYPRCGQRHVTWIESVIVSCAPSLGCRIGSRWVPLQHIHIHILHMHPLPYPLHHWAGLCPPAVHGVCIPKTTAEFKTIIVVYTLAWLRQRDIE